MPGTTYRRYLLGLLTVIIAFSFVDRLALGLVLQNIKTDLSLTDTQLGFLSGIAFALFYACMGVPIARWADRGNRVLIISLTAGLWSVAVALCGLAGNFVQLMLIRICAAVGEAGAFPSGMSLIADYFDRVDRPRAVAIYGLGGPLASVGGYLLVGWLNELYGWRLTFMLIGAPGLALAVLAWISLREPRRAPSTQQGSPVLRRDMSEPIRLQPRLKEAFAILWANATFRNLLLCLSVQYFFIYGCLQWLPTYFIRSFGLTSGQVGSWFAAIFGIGGLVGTYLGGELASRYAARDERLQLVGVAIAMACCGVFSALVFVSSSLPLAFVLLAGVSFALYAINGPLFALIQTLVPDRLRAVAVALVMLFANLIGMGLGPLATGALSDLFHAWVANASLRVALLTMSPGYALVGWLAWRASKTVMRDLASDPSRVSRSRNGQTVAFENE